MQYYAFNFLDGSREFLKEIPLPKADGPSTACECGAGIGRVTKGLLLDFCDRSDLVESSERLLFASPEYIGSDASKCRFFATELVDGGVRLMVAGQRLLGRLFLDRCEGELLVP